MTENPYRSPSTGGPSPKTRSTRWLVWSGVVCLGLALLCLGFVVVAMLLSFHMISHSTTTPSPADLARNIRVSLLPSLAWMPLAILGIVLLIAGLLIRRPVE